MQELEGSELKKHIFTVHCANEMSLLQRKLSNALLYNAYDALQTKDEHKITVGKLCDLLEYNSHDHRIVKNALKELISIVIEWNVTEESTAAVTDIWTASAILADAQIQGSVCTYSYSNRMRELLYMPQVYARLNMSVQAKFKSSYGLSLYENCVRYQNIKNTPWFKIEVFRKLLGVSPEKYAIFRDFKRKVLDVAVKEVNNHSNIVVVPEIQREGRAVASVRFLIDRKRKNQNVKLIAPAQNTLEPWQVEIKNRLIRNFTFSVKQAELLVQEYSEQYLLEKIKLVEESDTYRSGKVINLAKYLFGALKEDYKRSISSAHTIEQRNREKVASQIEKNKRTSEEDVLKRAYSSYVGEKIEAIFLKLEPRQKSMVMDEFREHLKGENNFLVLSRLAKNGLSDKIVKAIFTDFSKKHLPNWHLGIQPFFDFKNAVPTEVNNEVAHVIGAENEQYTHA